MTGAAHVPVLMEESMRFLAPEGRVGVFVDATVGGGGHTEEILRRAPKEARVVGFDLDASTLERVRERLAPHVQSGRLLLVHGDFRRMGEVLDGLGITKLVGVMADLGISSAQLDDPERGLSFLAEGPLDMRMDRSAGATAAELVNRLPEKELADILWQFGEERFSRRIARRIAQEREREYIATTSRLSDIIVSALPAPARHGRIHAATRSFQALRVAVNRELEGLDLWLEDAARRLDTGGRLVVIAFHSLEDRVIKHSLRWLERRDAPLLKVLTKKPVEAGEAELSANPRARSARLRAAERLPEGRAAA